MVCGEKHQGFFPLLRTRAALLPKACWTSSVSGLCLAQAFWPSLSISTLWALSRLWWEQDTRVRCDRYAIARALGQLPVRFSGSDFAQWSAAIGHSCVGSVVCCFLMKIKSVAASQTIICRVLLNSFIPWSLVSQTSLQDPSVYGFMVVYPLFTVAETWKKERVLLPRAAHTHVLKKESKILGNENLSQIKWRNIWGGSIYNTDFFFFFGKNLWGKNT